MIIFLRQSWRPILIVFTFHTGPLFPNDYKYNRRFFLEPVFVVFRKIRPYRNIVYIHENCLRAELFHQPFVNTSGYRLTVGAAIRDEDALLAWGIPLGQSDSFLKVFE